MLDGLGALQFSSVMIRPADLPCSRRLQSWRGPCTAERTKKMAHIRAIAAAAAIAASLAIQPAFARVDVKVEFDKTFDFKAARTWGWNPRGPGDVKMARTQEDDPEAMRAQAEPIILDAVTSANRGARTEAGHRRTGLAGDLLPAAQHLHVGADHRPVPAGHDRVGPPAIRAGDAVAQDDEQGIAGARSERQGHVVWRGVAQANSSSTPTTRSGRPSCAKPSGICSRSIRPRADGARPRSHGAWQRRR